MAANAYLNPGALADVLPPGGLTLVSSCAAESDLLADEVAAAGDCLGHMDFSGIFVPGLNRRIWASGSETRLTTFFQTPETRALGDRSRFLPLCYQDVLGYYRQRRPNAALFMCSPPDEDGFCSFGADVAFIAALWPDIPVRIAHINPAMPRTPGDRGIPISALTGYFEGDQALRAMPAGALDAVSQRIGAHVAPLIPDGATIQTGLGKIPDAVLAALSNHRGLRMHSGLAGDGVLSLIDAGAVADGPSLIVGSAIGGQPLYDRLTDPHFQFRPITTTHDPLALGAIERLVTINSAMDVDLFGQAYAEVGPRGFQSGPGGASDYARGGRLSQGGLRIIALPSEAKGTSRIAPPGAGNGPVSLSRFDIDVVVTEHGAADLRFRDHDARAKALIAIAAPAHREGLERAWSEVSRAI